MVSARTVIQTAEKYLGVKQNSIVHQTLIDRYNQVLPRPVGYKMTYIDQWCDAFVTVIGDETSASHLFGRECGVQRHLHLFEKMNIWLGKVRPKVGDLIIFDWDGGGFADHIGFVASIQGEYVTTIEGNSNREVASNYFLWNDWRIKGYARPKYSTTESLLSLSQIAQEVIKGKWGNGADRIRRLTHAGYDGQSVQTKVNELLDKRHKIVLSYDDATLTSSIIEKVMDLAKEYQILPSFLIVMLHYEGLWGNSVVAKVDNNWAGMTWSPNYVGHPEINKSKGSARPVSEGGHYIRYQKTEDFLVDWVYLLRLNYIYQVSGKPTFEQAVAGLFQIGGAKYDYAASGYQSYLKGMQLRKQAIEKVNPRLMDQLDREVSVLKSVDTIAFEVINGQWKNGKARQLALEAAGYDYHTVQTRVNEMLKN